MIAIVYLAACDVALADAIRLNLKAYDSEVRDKLISLRDLSGREAIGQQINSLIADVGLQGVHTLRFAVLIDAAAPDHRQMLRSAGEFLQAAHDYYNVLTDSFDSAYFSVVDMKNWNFADGVNAPVYRAIKDYEELQRSGKLKAPLYFIENNVVDKDFEEAAKAVAMNLYIPFVKKNIVLRGIADFNWFTLQYSRFELVEYMNCYIQERSSAKQLTSAEDDRISSWLQEVDRLLDQYLLTEAFDRISGDFARLPVNWGLLCKQKRRLKVLVPLSPRKRLKKLDGMSYDSVEQTFYGFKGSSAGRCFEDAVGRMRDKIMARDAGALADSLLAAVDISFVTGSGDSAATLPAHLLQRSAEMKEQAKVYERSASAGRARCFQAAAQSLQQIVGEVVSQCYKDRYEAARLALNARFIEEKVAETLRLRTGQHSQCVRGAHKDLQKQLNGLALHNSEANLLQEPSNAIYELIVRDKSLEASQRAGEEAIVRGNAGELLPWFTGTLKDDRLRPPCLGMGYNSVEPRIFLLTQPEVLEAIRAGSSAAALGEYDHAAACGKTGCTFEGLYVRRYSGLSSLRLCQRYVGGEGEEHD